ncbi:MAG TPA: hypothetical protein VGB00_02845 [Pyrinomonadaceae bacterium]|jgi:hypothetical protein
MPYQCQKCGREILWLKHFETGKSNPIEAEPAKDGNLVISREKGLYRLATPEEIDRAKIYKKNLYISHFAKCEFAKSFRKGK